LRYDGAAMPKTKGKAKPISKRSASKGKVDKVAKSMKAAAAKAKSTHPLNLPRNAAEVAAIEKVRRICLALPEASEKVAWGEPTWRAGKMFAQMETHHHGAEHVAVWLPARPGVQEALVEEDPERYFRPPYVGHKGWIAIRIDRKPDWATVAQLVAEAYRMVAAPHLIARLDAQSGERTRGWRADWIARDDSDA
jgi:hypothetical protein